LLHNSYVFFFFKNALQVNRKKKVGLVFNLDFFVDEVSKHVLEFFLCQNEQEEKSHIRVENETYFTSKDTGELSLIFISLFLFLKIEI
jgi:hypothetical protein